MRPRLRIFSALLTLSLLAFVDHQYFYEPERAAGMNPLLRQLVHLLVLLLFIPVGRRALRTRPGAWVRPFWTGTYLSLLGTLMTAGLLNDKGDGNGGFTFYYDNNYYDRYSKLLKRLTTQELLQEVMPKEIGII